MATTIEKVAANLAIFEKGYKRFAQGVLREAGALLVEHIRSKKFRRSGDPGPTYIVNRTGRLSASLRATVTNKGGRLVLALHMDGKQARILEEGGKTRPHLIRAKRASVLSFFWPKIGRQAFFYEVHHPGSTFKARRVLASSVEEKGTDILLFVEKEVAKEWERRLEG